MNTIENPSETLESDEAKIVLTNLQRALTSIGESTYHRYENNDSMAVIQKFVNAIDHINDKLCEMYELDPTHFDNALHNAKQLDTFLDEKRNDTRSIDVNKAYELPLQLSLILYYCSLFYEKDPFFHNQRNILNFINEATLEKKDIQSQYKKKYDAALEHVLLLQKMKNQRVTQELNQKIENLQSIEKNVSNKINHFEATVDQKIDSVTHQVNAAFNSITTKKSKEVSANVIACVLLGFLILATIAIGHSSGVFKFTIIPDAIKDLKKVEASITTIPPALNQLKVPTTKLLEAIQQMNSTVTNLKANGNLSYDQQKYFEEIKTIILPLQDNLQKIPLKKIEPVALTSELTRIEEILSKGSLYLPIIFERLLFAFLILIELFFFKVVLKNYFAARDELLQLELRKTLCLYAPSYKAFMNENADFTEFTNHIFNRLDHKLIETPDPFDAIEKLTPLIKALRGLESAAKEEPTKPKENKSNK